MKTNRVTFLIDGFNLYYSLRKCKNPIVKWLNIRALCESYLYQFRTVDPITMAVIKAQLAEIHYFSAYQNKETFFMNANSSKVDKHKKYIRCLEDTGIIVHLGEIRVRPKSCYHCSSFGRFDNCNTHCLECNGYIDYFEEKKTDVAIGVKAIELLCADKCDTVVIVSGDTDFVPVVHSCNKLFNNAKKIVFAFPFNKFNRELKHITNGSFIIDKPNYEKFQFKDIHIPQKGKPISKPESW